MGVRGLRDGLRAFFGRKGASPKKGPRGSPPCGPGTNSGTLIHGQFDDHFPHTALWSVGVGGAAIATFGLCGNAVATHRRATTHIRTNECGHARMWTLTGLGGSCATDRRMRRQATAPQARQHCQNATINPPRFRTTCADGHRDVDRRPPSLCSVTRSW